MKLSTALTATGLVLLGMAAGMNDAEAPFTAVIAVAVLGIVFLVFADFVYANDQKAEKEKETWRNQDEFMN
jgi:hypothetical protein